MVPAKKRDLNGDSAPENTSPNAARGFANVLSSIQGLRQRLDDFSLEEATQTANDARALIEKLRTLQAQLTLLKTLGLVITETKQLAGEVPQADFDLVAPDSFDNHPQLRAIVQAGKLIRMHRLMQAAHASAVSVSFDFDASLYAIPAPKPTNEAVAAPVVQPNVGVELSEPERPLEPSKINSTTTAAGNVMLAPDLTVRHETPSAPLVNAVAAQAGTPAGTYDFNDFKLDDVTESMPGGEDFVFPDKSVVVGPIKEKKDKTAPNQSHFDERLLSDVIDTYGEFVLSSKPAKTIDATPKVKPSITVQADSVLPLPAVPSVALVPVNTDPEAPLALPSPQIDENLETTVETHVPIVKNRGEIDRQLKSLIKDYGEYDLYPHAKPSHFNKTAAIVAFVVLGLVLGGFYLLKSPPPTAPVASESRAPEPIDVPSTRMPNSIQQKNQ
jgi:hypothetical protein